MTSNIQINFWFSILVLEDTWKGKWPSGRVDLSNMGGQVRVLVSADTCGSSVVYELLIK